MGEAGHATVVIADDQASSREHLTRLLTDAGYRVVAAFDGTQALRAIRRERPHLAILDVVMPNEGGPDVCAQVRADRELPYIPMMFVSSRADVHDRVRGLRAGADDFLAKPYDDDEMLARVEAMLRVKRLLDEADRDLTERREAVSADLTRDAVTGVWSASYLDERLEAELQRASRHNEPLSLAVIEIDSRLDLQARGDGSGEPLMIAAAEAINRCTRGMDVVTRCNGVAFAVILPNTHFAGAVATSDRIWRALADAEVAVAGEADERSLRASIGVACYPNRLVRQGGELLAFALSALERANTEGPARICLFQHQAYIFQPE